MIVFVGWLCPPFFLDFPAHQSERPKSLRLSSKQSRPNRHFSIFANWHSVGTEIVVQASRLPGAAETAAPQNANV
jgi:hypothetical protein